MTGEATEKHLTGALGQGVFPSSTPPCPQGFHHEWTLIREETDSFDKIINQSIQNLRQDNHNGYVSIETQTCNDLSIDYIDNAVGSNGGLSVTVAHKNIETESERYQLICSLREIIDLVKIELKDKKAAINNLPDVIKNFTANKQTNKKWLKSRAASSKSTQQR